MGSAVLQSPPFPAGKGWAPIEHMIALFADYLGTPAETAAPPRLAPLVVRTAGWFPPRRGGDEGLIFIARNPRDFSAALASPRFRKPAAFRALWIIDSFWTERLPPARTLSGFDAVAYTQAYDRGVYTSLFGARALHLPWGTDALGFGSGAAERDIDLLRVGRQPALWEDDDRTGAVAAELGLSFAGRPPMVGERSELQRDLMTRWYGRARFVLASSNRVDASRYTHPTKEYITARWTDALAAGATIAGEQPGEDLALIDWPGATLELATGDLHQRVEALARAVADWQPAQAERNHREALLRLDWRWRFAAMLEHLGVPLPDRLAADLERIRAQAEAPGVPA